MSVKITPPFEVVLRQSKGNEILYGTSITRIRDIVAGKDVSFPRIQAMSLLLASDFPDRQRDFQLILENENEPPDLRYFAAINLGKINSPAALEILHQNCTIRDQKVLVGVLKALGRIGNKSSIRLISSLNLSSTLAASQAAFANTLIAHRHGIEGYDQKSPLSSDLVALPEAGVNTFEIKPADKVQVEHCLRTLDEKYGIEVSSSLSYEVICPNNTQMVLLNREIINENAISELVVRKSFLGLISRKFEESDSYSVSLLLTTSPIKQSGQINLYFNRPNGDLIFYGTGRIMKNTLHFFIKAVSRPGAVGINIEGAFGNGTLIIKTAQVTSLVQVKKREPTREIKRFEKLKKL